MPGNETGIRRSRFIAALAGTALVAICCFTPILVILLSAVGLDALTRHLDFVLLPALGLFLVFTFVSIRGWKKPFGRSTVPPYHEANGEDDSAHPP